MVSYKGFYGDVMIAVYRGPLIDLDSGEKAHLMPENNTLTRGLRTYGAITDEDAIREGLVEGTCFPKKLDHHWRHRCHHGHDAICAGDAPAGSGRICGCAADVACLGPK